MSLSQGDQAPSSEGICQCYDPNVSMAAAGTWLPAYVRGAGASEHVLYLPVQADLHHKIVVLTGEAAR